MISFCKKMLPAALIVLLAALTNCGQAPQPRIVPDWLPKACYNEATLMSEEFGKIMDCDQVLLSTERRVFRGEGITAVTVRPDFAIYTTEKRGGALAHLMNLALTALGKSDCEPVSSSIKDRTSLLCPDGTTIEVGDGPTYRYGPDGSGDEVWTRNAVLTKKN